MRAARVAVCLLLPAAACALGGDPWQHVQGELHPADFSARQCVAGARPAFEPRPLEFCSWHVGRSCCTPMHDERSHEHFSKMTALGHPCSHSEHSVKHRYLRLRYWSCLQCDPGEPTYRYNVYDGYAPNNILPQVLPAAKTLVVTGFVTTELALVSAASAAPASRQWTSAGGHRISFDALASAWTLTSASATLATAPATSAEVSPEQVHWTTVIVSRRGAMPSVFAWRVCKSFVDAMWNGSGQADQLNGRMYDECGLVVNGNAMIPRAYYTGESGGRDLLKAVLPPGFQAVGQFRFEVVDDVASTSEHCRSCTVRDNQCHECANGCTFDVATARCRAFRHAVTPCFAGENTPLPGSSASGHTAPMAVGLTALFILLAWE
ncbi:hypothetical protein DIPPA_15376 [Diplonema papillatum]|nr:hypothetical protein DIPPA_15376 [Diplonema papillatum]